MATPRRQVGRYERSTVAGETVSAFMPDPLPLIVAMLSKLCR